MAAPLPRTDRRSRRPAAVEASPPPPLDLLHRTSIWRRGYAPQPCELGPGPSSVVSGSDRVPQDEPRPGGLCPLPVAPRVGRPMSRKGRPVSRPGSGGCADEHRLASDLVAWRRVSRGSYKPAAVRVRRALDPPVKEATSGSAGTASPGRQRSCGGAHAKAVSDRCARGRASEHDVVIGQKSSMCHAACVISARFPDRRADRGPPPARQRSAESRSAMWRNRVLTLRLSRRFAHSYRLQ